ncbi:hypothetical protein Esti_004312 [Eimeria stiedai]
MGPPGWRERESHRQLDMNHQNLPIMFYERFEQPTVADSSPQISLDGKMDDSEAEPQPLLYEQLALFPPDISPLCSNHNFLVCGSEAAAINGEEQEKGSEKGCASCAHAAAYANKLRHCEQWRYWLSSNWCFSGTEGKSHFPLKRKLRAGIPPYLRGAVWQQILQVQKFREESGLPPTLYEELDRGPSPPFSVLSMIARDVNRTFPKHSLFRDQKAAGQQARKPIFLFFLLSSYSSSSQSMFVFAGYCQGMGFVCGALLFHVEEKDAFYFLSCLLHKFSLGGLFLPGLPLLDKYFFQFQRLLQLHMPELSSHLQTEGVEPSMYLSGWILTLFAYCLSLDCLGRVWDVFFKDGEKMLFRTALAILKIHQEELLSASFEGILETLKTSPAKVASSLLIETALKLKVRRSTLNQLEMEYLDLHKAPGQDEEICKEAREWHSMQ